MGLADYCDWRSDGLYCRGKVVRVELLGDYRLHDSVHLRCAYDLLITLAISHAIFRRAFSTRSGGGEE
jgi:hypothetical protein